MSGTRASIKHGHFQFYVQKGVWHLQHEAHHKNSSVAVLTRSGLHLGRAVPATKYAVADNFRWSLWLPGFLSVMLNRRASKHLRAFALLWVSAFSIPRSGIAQQSASSLVNQTLKNEAAKRNDSEQFLYVVDETSTRTGGHRWTERVAQLRGGTLRRLVAIDGVSLTPDQARAEDQRIAKLVGHPDAFRKANRGREEGKDMATVMARAFVFSYDGESGGCTRVRFVPDPSFKPASYEERILHALEGTVSINETEHRVCDLNGKMSQTVEIGYGLVGKLEQGGRVYLTRSNTAGGGWQVTNLSIHLIGKILLLKDISQNHEEKRSEFRGLPADFSLAQAAEATKSQADAMR